MINIELDKRLDKNKNPYYFGKIKAPVILDFSLGMAFYAFLNEEGLEELEISCLEPDVPLSNFFWKDGNFKIRLEQRLDGLNEPFLLGKVKKRDMAIACHKGVSFMIFSSKKGQEELQISIQSHF